MSGNIVVADRQNTSHLDRLMKMRNEGPMSSNGEGPEQ